MEYQYRDILKEPPGTDEVARLASQAGVDVRDLINPKSIAFKAMRVKPETLTSGEAGSIIAGNPRVMYRPLLTDGIKLVIGFKPEEMEKLLK